MSVKRYVLITVMMITAASAYAETHLWIQPIGGVFNHWQNWIPPAVPGSDDIAEFNLGGSYQVDFTGPAINDELHIVTDSVTFDIPSGLSYALVNDTQIGSVGASSGSLSLTGGGMLDSRNHAYAGMTGTTGAVTITNGSWSCDQTIHIGWQGDGDLTVNGNGNVTAPNLFLGESSGTTATLDVNGGSMDVSDFQFGVSGIANGQIRNGAQLTTDTAVLGGELGSEATLTVSGSGTNWMNTNEIIVGDTGEADVTISDSATVSSSYGYIAQNGNGSTWFTGIVQIDGGTWSIGNDLILGSETSTGLAGILGIYSGSLEVDGITQIWNVSGIEMYDGYFETGELLTPGGLFNWTGGDVCITGSSGLVLGVSGPFYPELSVLEIDSAKALVVSYAMSVDSGFELKLTGGFFYSGILVLNGGLVTAPAGIDLDLTGGLTGNGEVSGSVSGNASQVITANGPLTMGSPASSSGFDFDGYIYIRSHAVVLHDSDYADLGIATNLESGGELTAANGLRMEAGEALYADGSTSVIAGEMYTGGTINATILPGAYLVFTGDVLGTGTFSGNIEFDQGYNPSSSPIQIPFDGNLQLTATSSVTMELNGTTPGSGHDQLSITYAFFQNGTLVVQLLPGYTPVLGDTYQLFDCGSIAGSFDAFDLPVLDPGLAWDTSDLALTGELHVITEPTPTPAPLPATGAAGTGLLVIALSVLFCLSGQRRTR
ncbi:hypothetical protein JW979_15755 [bacterium]|nr:hypothetical protein [candidate division CSSED10-310 bacterium]